MSPHFFHQQRGAIGLMAVGVLAFVLMCTLLVVDSGRLYLEKRKLQGVADTAALEAVSRNGTCLPG
ncbi:putative membrane protein [Pseudomonas tolaasii]